MINLIKAEFYKETHKKSFKISLLLAFIITIVFILISNNKVNNYSNYVNTLPLLTKEEYKIVNKYGDYSQYEMKYNKYIIETSNVITSNKHINLLKCSYTLMFVLTLFIIFKSYYIISYDLQRKTIRYVYQSSYNRLYILLSKLLFMILLCIIYYLIITITTLLLSSLLTNSNILEYILVYLKDTSLFLLPIIFIIILVFTITNIFDGNSISLIINTIVFLTSLTITNICLKNGINLINYTFLPYLDFSYFLDKVEVLYNNAFYNTNYNYYNAIIVFSIYSIIFIILNNKLLKKDL